MKTTRVFAIAAFAAAATLVMNAQGARAPAAADAERSGDVSLPQRRRAGERHRDCHRSVRAVRVGVAEGRLPGVPGQRAAADHALQQRTCAGQSRDCARYERQHGRRKNGRGARRAQSFSRRSCSTRTTRCSCIGSTRRRSSSKDGPRTSAPSAWRSGGCSRAEAPRCTTRSPRPCRSRRQDATGRRRSSSSPTATTRAATRTCSRSSG